MSTKDVPVVTLSAADCEALITGAAVVMRYDIVEETDKYVAEAQIQSARLSESLRRVCAAFRVRGNHGGGLVLGGIPVGSVPKTPEHADLAIGVTLEAAAVLSILASLFGEQHGYKPELGGNIVQDIIPVAGFEHTQQSIGSRDLLKIHVEMAFLAERCDVLGLLCVRPDHDHVAGTTLISIDGIVPLLSPGTIATLREPRFRTTVDGSVLRGAGIKGPIWVDPICALEGPSSRLRPRVDFEEIEGTDAGAARALEEFAQAAEQVEVAIRLEAGMLLLVDNMHAMHGRTPFTPRYDGMDRWLLRTFTSRDLARSEHMRPDGGRVIDPASSGFLTPGLRAA